MPVIAIALVTVLCWGLWLFPLQALSRRDQNLETFHVTLANLAVALGLAGWSGQAWPSWNVAVAAILGGGAWAIAGTFAFLATRQLGPARAMGIWSPLNVVISLVWGWLFFHEWRQADPCVYAGGALALLLLLGGILAVVLKGAASQPAGSPSGLPMTGVGAAIVTGILWGSYFLPVRFAGADFWVAALPMAAGMVIGSALLVARGRGLCKFPRPRDHARCLLSGLLWSGGNYGSLLLMQHVGTGRGFAIAQLCLVVNALAGIFVLGTPPARSAAARWTLAGCAAATCGGILLGLLG